MKSHLLSSPVIHSSTELIVTDEAIYSHGYWNAGISWPWSRIDRDDFQLRFYSGDRFDLPAGSAKLRNDTLIYAGPAGLYIHDLKNDRIDLFETGIPPGQVAFKKDHFLAADDTAVFEFGRTSELMATYPFPEPLPRSKWRPAPEKMETDGAVIWLTALEGLKGQLIRFDPGENTWRTWPIKDPYGRVIDLFVEEAFIWVISHQNIYRYDKKRGELEKLGAIFHEKTDSTLASTLYIRDAYDQGASIYLAGDEGVYELTKSTLEVKKSGLDLFDHFHTNQITAEGAFFFLAMDDGILQLPRKMLAESFVSREGFKLYKRE